MCCAFSTLYALFHCHKYVVRKSTASKTQFFQSGFVCFLFSNVIFGMILWQYYNVVECICSCHWYISFGVRWVLVSPPFGWAFVIAISNPCKSHSSWGNASRWVIEKETLVVGVLQGEARREEIEECTNLLILLETENISQSDNYSWVSVFRSRSSHNYPKIKVLISPHFSSLSVVILYSLNLGCLFCLNNPFLFTIIYSLYLQWSRHARNVICTKNC